MTELNSRSGRFCNRSKATVLAVEGNRLTLKPLLRFIHLLSPRFQVFSTVENITFFKKNYVFISGCAGFLLLQGCFSSCDEWGLLSSCAAKASHCSGFSCFGAQALGLQASIVAAQAQ